MSFPNEKAEKSLVNHLVKELLLCQKMCDLDSGDENPFDRGHKRCLGACRGKEPSEIYNLRVKEALKTFHYPHPNLLIIGKGRAFDEKSIVWIENGACAGYGYFESSLMEENIFQVKEKIQWCPDNTDVRR